MVVIQSVELIILLGLLKDVANMLLSGPIVTTLLVFACTTFYDDIKVFKNPSRNHVFFFTFI
jgi:hypothetical protein